MVCLALSRCPAMVVVVPQDRQKPLLRVVEFLADVNESRRYRSTELPSLIFRPGSTASQKMAMFPQILNNTGSAFPPTPTLLLPLPSHRSLFI